MRNHFNVNFYNRRLQLIQQCKSKIDKFYEQNTQDITKIDTFN